MKQIAGPQPVTFHFNRDVEKLPNGQSIGHSLFLVIVADYALEQITQGHPLQYLLLRFNGAATPGRRLRALADAVEAMEKAGSVADATPARGFFGKLIAGILRPFNRRKP